MTVTPLNGRTPHPPTRPHRTRRAHSRARPDDTSVAIGSPEASITLTFEVVLVGESRHANAGEVLDTLRRLADRLGAGDQAGPVLVTGPAPAPPSWPPASAGSAAPAGSALPAWSAAPGAAPPLAAAPTGADTIVVNPGARSVAVGGQAIAFTRVEFDLLLFLAEHPRRVFTRPQLLQSVWGHVFASVRTVDVHVRRLRAKLGPVVTTVRSVGYRLADDIDIRVVPAA